MISSQRHMRLIDCLTSRTIPSTTGPGRLYELAYEQCIKDVYSLSKLAANFFLKKISVEIFGQKEEEMRAESRLETEHDGHSVPLLQTTTPKRREREQIGMPCHRGRVWWGDLIGGWEGYWVH